MNINLSTLPYNQMVWIIVAIVAVVLAFVVIRFFWRHILKYLFQGCLVILAILALLAALHYYFKIF